MNHSQEPSTNAHGAFTSIEGTSIPGSSGRTPLVSVVVPTHNRREILSGCLDSIFGNSYKNLEVIVVDDASTDGTQELVAREFPTCRYSRHETPTLTAVCFNEAFAKVSGDIVLIVDDDNILHPDMISEIVKTFLNRPKTGVVGPICFYKNDPQRVMYAGARLTWMTRRAVFLGADELDHGQFNRELVVDIFPNCFAILRDVLVRLGTIKAKRLPFVNDDASLQMGAANLGYDVVLSPNAKIWHDRPLEHDSIIIRSRMRLYYVIRSKFFLERDFDNSTARIRFSVSVPLYFLYYVTRILFSDASPKARTALLLTALRALRDGLLEIEGIPYTVS